jgi:adenosylhomocysteine nucleosidase
MIAVLGAIREEIIDLRKQMAIEETIAVQGCQIYKGEYRDKDVLLLQTGFGKERVERAAKFILERYPITALISLSFAGALTEELKIGDVIICPVLYYGNEQLHRDSKSGSPCYSDADLVLLAAQALCKTFRLSQGSAVTMEGPVSEPKVKKALGKALSAKGVDMESYWIARIASAENVPFLAVLAVSDAVGDGLPPFDRFWDSGTWRWERAVLYFLTRPQQLIKLFRLYRNARRARKSLTAFMDCFIAKL